MDLPEDEPEEELDDGEGEEEEEEQDDPPPTTFGAPLGPAPTVAPSPTFDQTQRIAQARLSAQRKHSRKKDKGAAPSNPILADLIQRRAEWPTDVEYLWPAILRWAGGHGMGPETIRIVLFRTGSNFSGAQKHKLQPTFSGDQIAGDQFTSPGDALMKFINDYFHYMAQGPSSYVCTFYSTVLAEQLKQSEVFLLESPDVIQARNRRFAERAPQRAGDPPAPSAGYGAAGGGYAQPAPQPLYSGGQPHYPPAGESPEVARMRAENAAMHERLLQMDMQRAQDAAYQRGIAEEQRRAAMEGRPAVIPPPPAPVPPPGEDRLSRVERLLETLISRPGFGAPAADPHKSKFEEMYRTLIDTGIEQTFSAIKDTLTGKSAVRESPVSDAIVAEPVVEQPGDFLDFKPVTVEGAKWPDGSPVIAAPSKDGSGFQGQSPVGLVMSNPFILNKGIEVFGTSINKLAEAGAEALNRLGQPAAHIVREIPRGAIDASPNGAPSAGGWPQS